MAQLPKFPVAATGAMPRPPWLVESLGRGGLHPRARKDEATLLAIKLQEDAGLDVITDGEQRRRGHLSFVASKWANVKVLTLADLIGAACDDLTAARVRGRVAALGAPAEAIRLPVATGALEAEDSLAVFDARYLRRHTHRATKVTLPGPYTLARTLWVEPLSSGAYATRAALADDVVRLLRDEIAALAEARVDIIQLDEPALADAAFGGKPLDDQDAAGALERAELPHRSFAVSPIGMELRTPDEREAELSFAVDILKRLVAREADANAAGAATASGTDGPQLALHVNRGNWTQSDEVMLAGGYEPLVEHLARVPVQQYVLEFMTPRVGSLDVLARLPETATVCVGLADPRWTDRESADVIEAKARRVIEIIGKDRLWLGPDCAFSSHVDAQVSTIPAAVQKLEALAAAAHRLRTGALLIPHARG